MPLLQSRLRDLATWFEQQAAHTAPPIPESVSAVLRAAAGCMDGVVYERDEARALVREAFKAGFLAWAGPANQNESAVLLKDEEEAWADWSTRAFGQSPPTG